MPGMQLDLGGIAKGYAADEALAVLAQARRDARLWWRPAATSPSATRRRAGPAGRSPSRRAGRRRGRRILLLKNAAVSTSGDSEQFVEIGGVRYSHIVDPRTGLGLTGRRSVTVVAKRGAWSDPLTKLASVLDADKALAILNKLDDTACRIVVRDGDKADAKTSERFKDFVAPKE